MPRKIILLEANEIPYRIYDHFIAGRPGSTLARRLPRCRQYLSTTPDTCHLSPWITWPTLHRGVNNEAHGIRYFGQDLEDANRRFPTVFDLLVAGGVETGVFGSLHSWPVPDEPERFSFYVPDPFAATPETHPASLGAFQSFNLSMSRQSARNVSSSIDLAGAARFLARAPALGLRAPTVASLARQLVDERIAGWKRVRRRTFQSVIAFDLFMKLLDTRRPDFCSFFTNHAASAMHRFWAALFPDEYDDLELDEAWQARHRDEIGFAMEWTDHFFGELVRFADRNPQYLVVVASSMGQQAAHGQRVLTQVYLRQPERLMQRVGLGDDEWARRPSMEPNVSIQTERGRQAHIASLLEKIEIQGRPLDFEQTDDGFFDLRFGQVNVADDDAFATIRGERVAFSELGLERVQIEDEAGSTAYHIPTGSLFVYDPQRDEVSDERTPVLTTDLAPSVLAACGVPVPDYMRPPGAIALS